MVVAGLSAAHRHSERLRAAAEALRTRVLHLDQELLVLDKPAGLAVQGGPGTLSSPQSGLCPCQGRSSPPRLRTRSYSLADNDMIIFAVVYECERVYPCSLHQRSNCCAGVSVSVDEALAAASWLPQPEGSRPKLVHRLDRETSGALVVARTPDAAAWLSACFREHAESAEAVLAGMSPVTARGHVTPSSPMGLDSAGSRVQHGGELQPGRREAVGRLKSRAVSVPSPGAGPGGAAVQRTYWAIVETGSVPGGSLPASGSVIAPIWSGGGSGDGDPGSGRGVAAGRDGLHCAAAGWLPTRGWSCSRQQV